MKKIFIILSVTLLIMMLVAGCGGQDSSNTAGNNQSGSEKNEAALTLKLGHVVAEDTALHKGALKFAEAVKEKSDGKIIVDVYPSSQLGSNREMIESLQLGSVDFCLPNLSLLAGFTDQTAVFELPYLFKNDAAAEAVFDGPIGQEIFDSLEDSSIKGLAYWTQGWRNITTGKTPVREPSDMEGLKIRTMENKRHMQHFKTLTANPIPMPFAEVFTGLQQGIIDGQENPYVNIYLMGFHEVQKYIIETRHIYDAIPLVMSKVAWDKLTPEQQQVIMDTAKEVTAEVREISRQDDERYKKAILEEGETEIIELTAEQRQKFFEAAQPVYKAYEEEIGKDRIQRVLDAQKGF